MPCEICGLHRGVRHLRASRIVLFLLSAVAVRSVVRRARLAAAENLRSHSSTLFFIGRFSRVVKSISSVMSVCLCGQKTNWNCKEMSLSYFRWCVSITWLSLLIERLLSVLATSFQLQNYTHHTTYLISIPFSYMKLEWYHLLSRRPTTPLSVLRFFPYL